MFFKYLLSRLYGILAGFLSVIINIEAIIGGNKARPHDFPYQVAVIVHPGPQICGGGILNDNFILSAAHCVINDKNQLDAKHVVILAGAIDLYMRVTQSTPFIRVKNIYVPREYKPPTNKASGDIAVFKLQLPLRLHVHKHLHPLRLPNETYHRQTGKIAGFGLQYMEIINDKEEGGHYDSFLRYATANLLNIYQCKRDNPDHKITSKHICAKVQQHENEQSGVCTGDSGGPLVIDYHIVVGVLSVSPFGCSEHLRSGVYTKVAHYTPFIERAMEEKPHDDIRKFQLE